MAAFFEQIPLGFWNFLICNRIWNEVRKPRLKTCSDKFMPEKFSFFYKITEFFNQFYSEFVHPSCRVTRHLCKGSLISFEKKFKTCRCSKKTWLLWEFPYDEQYPDPMIFFSKTVLKNPEKFKEMKWKISTVTFFPGYISNILKSRDFLYTIFRKKP